MSKRKALLDFDAAEPKMATAAERPPSFGEEVPRHSQLWLPPVPRRRSEGSGGVSPSASAMRTSLQKLSEGRRARRLTFFRNGDRFDRGLVYALSLEKVRTFEALLEDLTRIMVELPMGVRFIFSEDGREKVSRLDHLCEGSVYVCSSTDHFVRLPYGRQEPPRPHWTLGRSTRGIPGSPSSATNQSVLPSHHGFVRPKLITVIRNGVRPRKAVRVLLNHKTARSFEQVLDDVTRVIKLDSGAVRKVFTLTGKPVTSLADFFGLDDIFIAYGVEKHSHDDFDLDSEECKHLNGSMRVRREQRFSCGRPMSPISDVSSNLSFQSSHSISPKASKKFHLVNHMALPETVGRLYSVMEMLGDGNFARVYQCVSRESGVEYALKIIDKDKCRGKEQMIANEVAILRRVQHPNVVRLVEEFDFDTELYLVMELVKGGDLFDAIAAVCKFPEHEASQLVGHLASALAHLHSLRVVHRDIKPENLLVGAHGALKLADFGLATELPCDGSLLSTVCGTPTYVAPEILAETGYSLEVDVWAMGVITYILLCGFPPFVSQTNNQDELFDQILSGRFEFMAPYWDGISASAQDLIKGMLQVDVTQRLTAVQVLTHPWLLQHKGADSGRQSETWQVDLCVVEGPQSNMGTTGAVPSAMVLDDWCRIIRLLAPFKILTFSYGKKGPFCLIQFYGTEPCKDAKQCPVTLKEDVFDILYGICIPVLNFPEAPTRNSIAAGEFSICSAHSVGRAALASLRAVVRMLLKMNYPPKNLARHVDTGQSVTVEGIRALCDVNADEIISQVIDIIRSPPHCSMHPSIRHEIDLKVAPPSLR